ncbi:MAG TPA: translation initiation factor IF-6 [Nitrososphaerales archaeon]|nr:translation initiation factor IF-6 [Nitrososphaerales archaeon]
MGLHLVDIYRSPNIGVFLKANDKFILVPKGLAQTKSDKLSSGLEVSPVPTSIAESRLIGPLVSMNNHGILVSRLAESTELTEIASATGLNVARFNSKFTAVGNLVAANDRFAVASPLLDGPAVSQVKDVLGTEVEVMPVKEYTQVGALMVATNKGAAVYPGLDEKEISRLGDLFGVDAAPTSVNRGVPYVASGLVANSKNAVVGSQTTGPELVFITRALSV